MTKPKSNLEKRLEKLENQIFSWKLSLYFIFMISATIFISKMVIGSPLITSTVIESLILVIYIIVSLAVLLVLGMIKLVES